LVEALPPSLPPSLLPLVFLSVCGELSETGVASGELKMFFTLPPTLRGER